MLPPPGINLYIAPFTADVADPESAATVGDWLLLDTVTLRPQRLLRRQSLFKRRAAGSDRRLQLIAANVDTLFSFRPATRTSTWRGSSATSHWPAKPRSRRLLC